MQVSCSWNTIRIWFLDRLWFGARRNLSGAFLCYNIFMQITLVLHNIRSTYNVGAILRTAEGLGIDQVAYSGYTPRYNDTALLPHLREKLNHQIAKSAIGAENLISQTTIDNIGQWLDEQKTHGNTVIGLENNLTPEEEQRRIVLGRDFGTDSLAKRLGAGGTSEPPSLVLVLGEEVAGIPAAIRPKCDFFLEIPMAGQKESFNVSVATAIALWELIKLRQ